MAQTKPKAGQFYGVSDNGTDGEFLQTDGTGGMTWASPITNPTITSIDYPGTATAANPAGGESVIINGTLFASGITCTVGGTTVTTVFNSATQITINTPAKSAGAYAVAVTNSNGGTASQANFIQYSGIPIWTTAAGNIGSVTEAAAASFQVTATEGTDTIEYAVTTGTLPTGLSLATATGAITGTAPAVSADTTTTFSITATDDENQTSAVRSFNIIVTNDAPSDHFAPYIYTGNSGTQNITLNFKPDLVWIKERGAAEKHILTDSIRGTNSQLSSNSEDGVTTYSSNVTSFNSNGFTLGSATDSNGNNNTFVAWNLKAGGAAVANTNGTIDSQVSVNNTLGFSIVKYTGNNTAGAKIGHGLSSIPELIIVKNLGSNNWCVYSSGIGNTKYLRLNSTQGEATANDRWNNTTPTSSVFTIGSDGEVNNNANNYIAYTFASKAGFSKVGSYTGNGSLTSIVTGFEPSFLMIKRNSGSGSWIMLDDKRDTSNPRTKFLTANTTDAEGDAASINVDFLANGFTVDGNNADINNGTYIYLAFAADGTTSTPTLAKSFAPEIYTGNGGTQSITTEFKPDFTWIKQRSTPNRDHMLFDSVRGPLPNPKILYANLSGIADPGAAEYLSTFNNNGFTIGNSNYTGASGKDYVAWSWKAGGIISINTDGSITSLVSANQAAGFSIAKWTANSTTLTAGHGLGVIPDLVILKVTTTTDSWFVNSSVLTNQTDRAIRLNETSAEETNSGFWNNTAPTSTTISVGNGVSVSGQSYIAYSFKSITGYSKVGTYTGNGTAGHNITTGFAAGFLMIKRTSESGNWYMFDNKRTTGVYSDQLIANTNGSEATGTYVSINATGFALNTAASGLNDSSAKFIYLAIKEN
jgi:hypothetical protein